MFLKKTIAVGLCVLGLLWLGCHRRGEVPGTVPAPSRFSQKGAVAFTDRWWESFGDPRLNQLMDRLRDHNLSLKAAWERLEAARALADERRAALWPQAEIQADASRRRSNLSGPDGTSRAAYTTGYSSSVRVSYELDLWGRLSARSRAQALESAATEADYHALSVSLASTLAQTWYDAVAQQARLDLLKDQARTNQTYLRLVKLRFAQGLVSSLDLYQQQELTAGVLARIPLAEARLATLKHQLAVLMGQPPKAHVASLRHELPALPALPEPGLPADLLQHRPDLQAIQLRVAAADQRLAAAIADRFPSLRLAASGGYSAGALSGLFENLIWELVGSLTQTFLDGGGQAAAVRHQQALLREQLCRYGQQALGSFQEVEDALIREAKQQRYLDHLAGQLQSARNALRQSRQQYMNGLSDYLPVLNQLQTLQQLQLDRVSGQQALIGYRIALCKALGGTWIKDPAGYS